MQIAMDMDIESEPVVHSKPFTNGIGHTSNADDIIKEESKTTQSNYGKTNGSPSISSPIQSGKVYVGPGAKKDAEIIGFGLGNLRTSELEDLELAKKYAMDQSIRYVMEKQRQAHQQQQQKVALYSQALALMSRIYVGSINFDVFEDQIRTAFGIFGPIKNVNMSLDPSTGHHKGFCFIEYEIPEAAILAKDAMNGRFFGGRTIKVMPVGRQDSTPQALPIIDMVLNEARQYNRIYVASVHPDITEQDLRSVFIAFGEITKCQLARHSSGKRHRGFGYMEFKSADSVKEAIDGMNNFDLGGQFLKVGRSVTPPDAINYLSVSTSASALPAAAAIAAAEATAKIHAQEILGTGRSPGSSPKPSGFSPDESRNSSSPVPTQPQMQPTQQQASTVTTGRRQRGFGGFASSVPPPAVVQSLPAPPQKSLLMQADAESTLGSHQTDAKPVTITGPQLVIPTLGSVLPPIAAPAHQTLASAQCKEEDNSIDDFYSSLNDDKFEPPKLVTPSLITSSALPATKPVKQKKEKLHLLDRIGEKLKAKSDGFDASKPATFAPLAPYLAPKDPNMIEDENNGPQLAISGPESWTALALREDGIITQNTNESNQKGNKGDGKQQKRKGKGKKPKITSGPKLNTATKIAAANLAGALSDQLQAQKEEKGEEASLASQEHIQIRGNDARHLLIQKLMRTNRSSVILLKNMVTSEGVDEFLEDEIREECQKYGAVTDVVIVQEEDTGSVKIFVRFAEPVQAEEARKAIDGRFFDGRTVIAQSYDQVLFDHDDFTG